jgi:DNA-binding CsgD family transcriptional regulator
VLDVLNLIPFGVILVGNAGRVLMTNERARRILDRKDGLVAGADGLAAADSKQTSALRKLVQEASLTGAGLGLNPGGALRLERPAARRKPLSLLVAPVTRATYPLREETVTAAVLVNDAEDPGGATDRALQRLYDLTRSESRVALCLIQGKSLRDTASELGISFNTARHYLKQIFLNTGVARQSDLILLVLSNPAAFEKS